MISIDSTAFTLCGYYFSDLLRVSQTLSVSQSNGEWSIANSVNVAPIPHLKRYLLTRISIGTREKQRKLMRAQTLPKLKKNVFLKKQQDKKQTLSPSCGESNPPASPNFQTSCSLLCSELSDLGIQNNIGEKVFIIENVVCGFRFNVTRRRTPKLWLRDS